MKRFESLLMIIFATLFFTGCSNEFEKIFNGEEKEAISPLVSGEEEALENLSGDDRFYLAMLVSHTMFESGVEAWNPSHFHDRLNSELPWEYLPEKCGARAMVINSRTVLLDYTMPDGSCIRWPEIDLESYSLVIGYFRVGSSGEYLSSQRIVMKGGKPELYLKINNDRPGKTYGGSEYFVAIYPKISFEGEVSVNVWRTWG